MVGHKDPESKIVTIDGKLALKVIREEKKVVEEVVKEKPKKSRSKKK